MAFSFCGLRKIRQFLILVILFFVFFIAVFYLHRERLKCRANPLKNIAVVLVFNSPYYENVPILQKMYGNVFGKLVFCGEQPRTGGINYRPDIVLNINQGHLAYHCAAKLIQLYPGFSGYLYGNDDMIINWWNLVNRDQNKIWQGAQIVDFTQTLHGKINTEWIWWNSYMGLTACRKFYQEIIELSKTSLSFDSMYHVALHNGNGHPRCGKGWSDFFYIPGRFTTAFVQLSEIAYKHKTFLEIAVNNILRSLDYTQNFEQINGVYLPDLGVEKNDPMLFWRKYYTHQLTFIHPFKFKVKDTIFNMERLDEKVITYTKYLNNKTYC
ncbi:uncharacterized protein [Clytia hemisphaerica]|uniref:Uncharacterized protein n=1 Tax=Clytia hemisphaerica TaxID=252671 RepID=A0A7M5WMN4_9CNID